MMNAVPPEPRVCRTRRTLLSVRALRSGILASFLTLASSTALAQQSTTIVNTPDPTPPPSTTVVTTPDPAPPPATTVVTPAQPATRGTTVVTPSQPAAQPSTTVVAPTPAPHSTTVVNTPAPDGPSVFESGYRGLLSGTVVGLGGGYLAARRDGFERSDWRALGLGMGIGALTGAALGVTLGIADKSGSPGGRYVARDLALGALFGSAIGAIGGGIAALAQDEPERVLFGASIGVLAGAGLGILTGVIEGQTKRQRNVTAVTAGLHVQPTVAVAPAGDGTRVGAVLPGVSGRF